MKLVTYEHSKRPRLGVVEGQWIVDVRAALEFATKRMPGALASDEQLKAAATDLVDSGTAPRDMRELLARDDHWRRRLAALTRAVKSAVDPKKAPKGLFTPLADGPAVCARAPSRQDHLCRPELR